MVTISQLPPEIKKDWTVKDIKSAFNNQKLSPQEAINLLTDTKTKPWHTKEWRKLRESLIATACTQCGSDKPPLVLQHTWHPRKMGNLIAELRGPYFSNYESKHPREYLTMSVPVPEGDLRQGCPKCQRISIIWRKTLQDWRCGGKGCGITFSKPANIRMLSDEQVTTWRNARRAAKQKWFEDYRSFTDEVVLTQAVLISIEEHERYISCKDTTTFCKKCAYLWDMKKRRYCQECKDYVSLYSRDCPNCVGDQKAWNDYFTLLDNIEEEIENDYPSQTN